MSRTSTKLIMRRSKSSGRAHIEGRLVVVDMMVGMKRGGEGQRRRTEVLRHADRVRIGEQDLPYMVASTCSASRQKPDSPAATTATNAPRLVLPRATFSLCFHHSPTLFSSGFLDTPKWHPTHPPNQPPHNNPQANRPTSSQPSEMRSSRRQETPCPATRSPSCSSQT